MKNRIAAHLSLDGVDQCGAALHHENDETRSFVDRGWLQKVHDRLIRDVRALQPYQPLYYSLGDETGIADLSAFWDFDFSEASLTAMREW